MEKLLLLLLFIPLAFACSDDDSTSLTVANLDSTKPIIEVTLVSYEFTDLNITEGQTKRFDLDGIDGGLTDVNVSIKVDCSPSMDVTRSKNLDFSNGSASITIMDDGDYPPSSTMGCDNVVIQD